METVQQVPFQLKAQRNSFKFERTIYDWPIFKIVYMFFGSKMALKLKKYIRKGVFRNRIYKIACFQFTNKECIYTISEKTDLYI